RAIDGYDSDLDLPLAKGGMLTYVPGSASGPQGTCAAGRPDFSGSRCSPGCRGPCSGPGGGCM
ncbi:hypothetical protein, partial [Streptomyces rubiginosohelvolus]